MTAGPDRRATSQRARTMVTASKVAPYIAAHIERSTASPKDERYLSLAVAENHLMWDLVDEKANTVRDVPPSAFGYEDMRGSRRFRAVVAEFLGEHLFGRDVDPQWIVPMAGAGSVVEALAWSLVDPGEGILIPTPSYASYWSDIESRTGAVAVAAPTSADRDFRMEQADLDAAADAADVPIAALLITNPSNPIGRMLTEEEITMGIAWARARGIPVIMNEIYGLSVHGDTAFRSAVSRLGGFPDDIHFVWALSKDFASSGLRSGIAVTSHPVVHTAMMEQLYFSATSGDTQHLAVTMLSDDAWVERYLHQLHRRLRSAYELARGTLADHGIGIVEGDAGIFFLADLRPHLDAPTWDAEDRLWRRILDEADVNLTPGSACRIDEPGFMRVCFASASPDTVVAGLERVCAVVAR